MLFYHIFLASFILPLSKLTISFISLSPLQLLFYFIILFFVVNVFRARQGAQGQQPQNAAAPAAAAAAKKEN